MKYRIGEIAEMLGVSVEAIRYFEKIGLINPTRDEKNGYRVYETGEHNILMRARGYSRFGFTLSEAADLISQGDLSDLAAAFKDREKQLEESIAFQQVLLNCLKERQRHLERISEMVGLCVLERSPALYGIVYRRDYEILQDKVPKPQVRQWSDYKPITEALMIYPKKMIENRERGYYMGLCVQEEFARGLGLDHQDNVMYFPPQRAVYTVVKLPHSYAVSPNMWDAFGKALEYIKENGLQIAGDSYGRTLHTSKKDGEYVHYCEQWFPVK